MKNQLRFHFSLILFVLVFGLGATNSKSVNVTPLTDEIQSLEWTVDNSWAQAIAVSVSMTSANDGWILGSRGFPGGYLAHWNGATWADWGTVPSSQAFVRGDIQMVSANDGWIVIGGPLSGGWPNLAQSIIYRWDGSTWTQFATVTDPNAVSLTAIDMISDTDGWATAWFNFGSHFYHWNGSTWQKVSSIWLPLAPSNDIDMVSAIDGWAVGWGIARWDGNAWTSVTSPVTTTLNSIAMVSATNGWAVGEGGVILNWDGNTWFQMTSPVTTTLNSIAMVSATNGWAVGEGGVILHWDGNTWTTVTSPVNSNLDAVDMVSATDGWAVGDEILHYGLVGPISKIYLPLVLK